MLYFRRQSIPRRIMFIHACHLAIKNMLFRLLPSLMQNCLNVSMSHNVTVVSDVPPGRITWVKEYTHIFNQHFYKARYWLSKGYMPCIISVPCCQNLPKVAFHIFVFVFWGVFQMHHWKSFSMIYILSLRDNYVNHNHIFPACCMS